MKRITRRTMGGLLVAFVLFLTYALSQFPPLATAQPMDGKAIFRFDTFGDEQLWTDFLRMHEAIDDVDPKTALSVGLKLDVEALPSDMIAALKAEDVDLSSPAVTIELLRLNAVVGVKGNVNSSGQLTSIGITTTSASGTTRLSSRNNPASNSVPPIMGNIYPVFIRAPAKAVAAYGIGFAGGGMKFRKPLSPKTVKESPSKTRITAGT